MVGWSESDEMTTCLALGALVSSFGQRRERRELSRPCYSEGSEVDEVLVGELTTQGKS